MDDTAEVANERLGVRRKRRVSLLGVAFSLALATFAMLFASGAVAAPDQAALAAAGWQYAAADEQGVSPAVRTAASQITVGIVDTGADVNAPSIAATHPSTYDVATGGTRVPDQEGHGTFVASLVAGFGGNARLLIVRAAALSGRLGDVTAAEGIVYAVDRGARILNLSFSGSTEAPAITAAVSYAIRHGALVVTAAGNAFEAGNPIQYPAALFSTPTSTHSGGAGLVVAASDPSGQRAPFSSTGRYISLAAPGVGVLGSISPLSPSGDFAPAVVPGSKGLYGLGSGTSFSAAEISGAAALVWAAAPSLRASDVAHILEQTASGSGSWNPDLGYGIVNVARAVAAARARDTIRTRLTAG